MPKVDTSVGKLVEMIQSGELRLPEMQRRYVWPATRVRDLLDSLYRGYPSGTILVWETDQQMPSRDLAVSQATSPFHGHKLLLDGQQRLTSLSAIMRGEPVSARGRKKPIEILFNLNHPDTPEHLEVEGDSAVDADDSEPELDEEEDEDEELPRRQDRRDSRERRGPHEAEASDVIERSEIQWGMTAIPYVIRRTDREKTVALAVEGRGKLVVTAPEGVSVDRLNGIVRKKADWVVKRIRRVSTLPPPPSEREFMSGETVRYLGGQYRLKVFESGDPHGTRIWAGWYEVPIPPGLDDAARRREVRHRLAGSLKQHADLYLPDRLGWVCRTLRIDKPSIVVCEQRKRWGSCDRNGVLRINWRIVQAHIPLIEYVLVHELAHLQHRGHDRAFWAAVGQWMPDYEERRARLRELGPSLVW
jgi:predicted metal-dependent hydrolase